MVRVAVAEANMMGPAVRVVRMPLAMTLRMAVAEPEPRTMATDVRPVVGLLRRSAVRQPRALAAHVRPVVGGLGRPADREPRPLLANARPVAAALVGPAVREPGALTTNAAGVAATLLTASAGLRTTLRNVRVALTEAGRKRTLAARVLGRAGKTRCQPGPVLEIRTGAALPVALVDRLTAVARTGIGVSGDDYREADDGRRDSNNECFACEHGLGS